VFRFVAASPLDESSYLDVEKLVARFVFPDEATMARALAPLGLGDLAASAIASSIGVTIRIAGIDAKARRASRLELWIVLTPREPSPALKPIDYADAAAVSEALAGLEPFALLGSA
jgi:hypothetical protein